MCKWLSNIKFPTEILGRKRKVVKMTIPQGTTALSIQWQGKGLLVRFTIDHYNHYSGVSTYEQAKYNFVGGGTEFIPAIHGYDRFYNNEVYFSCINVTSLVVNGQTLI